MDKLLLVDGNSIANRAFYGAGASMLRNSEGTYTGAVHGFLHIITRILEQEKPTMVCVAFDAGKHTFRHDIFKEYKGKRKGMPEELRMQMPLIKEALDLLGVSRCELSDIEADDIIGTLSVSSAEKNVPCLILTGDKDSLQLVNDKVTILLPITSEGTTTTNRVTPDKVKDVFYGADADMVVPMKALMGDSSDNIPGCPGIGPKGALSLLQQFGSIDGIFENIDKVAAKGTKEKLENGKDLCYLSLKLAEIKKDVPLADICGGDIENLAVKEKDYPGLLAFMKKLELRKLIKSMKLEELAEKAAARAQTDDDDAPASLFDFASGEEGGGVLPQARKAHADYVRLTNRDEMTSALDSVTGAENLYIIVKKQKGALSEIILHAPKDDREEAFTVDMSDDAASEGFIGVFGKLLSDESVKKFMFDGKALVTACLRRGVLIKPVANDLAICAYLSDSTRGLDEYVSTVRFYTGVDREDIYFMPEVFKAADERIARDGMKVLLEEIEIPMITVLAKMECRGVRVNADILREEGKVYEKNLDELKKKIYALCGMEFNINSPKQLGEVLFDKLGIEGGKKNKTRTGYKTGQEVLEELVDKHPVVKLILEYRQNAKLKSTYIDGLLGVIDEKTGRVYTTFNQTVTATGRLSSSEPNLQNIPVRHELGRVIRKAFVAGSENMVLVDADYSQIELRLMACMSGDRTMVEAFKNGTDIHTLTAADVNDVPLDQVTYEMRSAAKAVNFGIIYGMSEYGLAAEIGVSVREARRYIAGYFKKFPGVKDFLEKLKLEAKRTGYAKTPMGRRRYLPELVNPKYPVRQFGERVAMNMPIQGAAADIMKLAMVKVDRELERRGLKSCLVLQVHDEILCDCPKEEEEEVKALVTEMMEGAVDLEVPFPVSVVSSYEWEK
ncbi:MAG: DNA polymerase I [Clostridia bacterium]|nr:DNA polymerase I [Clostridia bacterium]